MSEHSPVPGQVAATPRREPGAPLVSLAGKTIIVTGASRGLGLATARLALELGANVVAVSRSSRTENVLAVQYGLKRVLCLTGNVADAAFAQASVDAAIARFGTIDGLVNNAGNSVPAMLEKMTLAQWSSVIDVHLTGSFLWMQAVGRHMLARSRAGEAVSGAIVNVSSDGGRKGSIGQANYSSAKAGLLGLSMSAAREWSKYGIRTNAVCFGVVETDMTQTILSDRFRANILKSLPLGRWAQPDEAVATVCFLLSDASSYVTGQTWSVNGGGFMSA